MFRPAVALLLSGLLASRCTAQITLYVSPSGDDRFSGRLAAISPDHADGPLRSLDRAIQLLRAERAERGPLHGIIQLRRGTYPFSRTLRLTAGDSNTTIRPYRHDHVTLSGSMEIQGFAHLRPGQEARVTRPDSILVAHLPFSGDVGAITPRSSPGLELFFNGRRMPLARWPNEGWLHVADVPQTGDSLLHPGLEREKRFDGVPAGRHFGRITYEGSRPHRWRPDTNITLHGYWTFDWSDSYQRVAGIDTSRHEFRLSPPHHGYGYTKNQRYYAVNVLEELDRPGEWYCDRAEGLLYFWPPSSKGKATVSRLKEPFFILDSVSHIALEGLEMTESQAGGVVIRGGNDNLVRGTVLRNLGGEAIRIEGGTRNGVEGCELTALALGGILLRGGDRMTLTPAGHYAANNHIHHFSEWVRTGQYAIILEGVGNKASHNEIHDSPFEALTLRGNDHVIEYNDVYRVTQETGDAGAFHTGRNWTWQGNIIRYNYFHDLQGPGLHGVMGVYLDDWACGFTVTGNVFYRAGRATLIGGGRNNTVENNIFIECSPSIHIDARGLGWAGYYFDGTRTELFDQMKEVKFDTPPYSTRYPQLLTMYDGETRIPKYNVIRNNVSWGGRWMDVYDYNAFDFSVVSIAGNVIGDSAVLRRREPGRTGWDPYYLDIDTREGYELLGRSNPEIPRLFSGNRLFPSPIGSISRSSGAVTIPPSKLPAEWDPIPFAQIGRVKKR